MENISCFEEFAETSFEFENGNGLSEELSIVLDTTQAPYLEFNQDLWSKQVCKTIGDYISKAEIIRGLALTAHLKNLRPIVCYYYVNEMAASEDLRNELSSIFKELEDVFVGHYPHAHKAKEVGSRVFHFMVKIIDLGKETKGKANQLLNCVVNGCNEVAINSHTISRAHNFRKGVNYYRLKTSIKDEGKANSGVYLGRVISSNASTRHMFCAHHDRELFLPIEGDSNLDITDTNHMYLQNWRTFLWEQNIDFGHIRNMRKELEKNHQILNQRILNMPTGFVEDFASYVDAKHFQEENKDIVYLAITFTNKPPILASFCENLNLIYKDPEGKKINQCFYFQLLHNNNKHCLIISGFRTPEMENALSELKAIYEKDNYDFWQKVFNFIPFKKNVFFDETFTFNTVLANKLKQIHLKNKDLKNKSLQKSLPTTFSKKELFSFFGLNKMFTNLS